MKEDKSLEILQQDIIPEEELKGFKNIWFKTQVVPPQENKKEYVLHWAREKHRCINGFKIANGQVYIPGWLYFHTVYWSIELDKQITNPVTGEKTSYKTVGTPLLRDNEWITADDLQECARQQKIYNLVGARGFGKSMMASSFIAYPYTFIDNSESLITAGNHPDIGKLAEKVNLGLTKLVPEFQKQRLKNNWKVEVKAGWINNKTNLEEGSLSKIGIRNYDNGTNTMATNGTRPLRQVVDEIGKIPNFINCVLDSMPSWMNDYGFFSIPFLTGTGGEMEVGKEAGQVFNNPRIYNVLAFPNPEVPGSEIGRFIPVTMARNEFKEEWTLFDYLTIKHPEKYGDLINHPDLENIKILVSNEEKCMEEFVIPRRERAKKSASSKELIKEKAYYPIVPSESFLTLSANDFPVSGIAEHQIMLTQSNYNPVCVELYEDANGTVRHKSTDKKPVRDFPVKASSYKEGVIEIVEFPVSGSKWNDYIISLDPYKVSESDYSDSLGSAYVFKRTTNDLTEPYQHMPVAWYTGRPKSMKDFNENVRMLAKMYNCEVMSEANDESFIQYMQITNNQRFLAKGQSSLKEIAPNSKFKGAYGIPANTRTIQRWNNNAVAYTLEIYNTLKSEDGETKDLMGYTRILDIMLLEEMKNFNKNSGNYDRLRAFSIGLTYALQLDSALGKVKIEEEEYEKTREKYIHTPFEVNKFKNSQINNTNPTTKLNYSPFETKFKWRDN